MSRSFFGSNRLGSSMSWSQKTKFANGAHKEFNGLGDVMIKDVQFHERIHYGVIDHENNSVIPDEKFIVNFNEGRVFDFVADAISVMKLNYMAALQKGLVNAAGSAVGELLLTDSYHNPRIKYELYIGTMLKAFNREFLDRSPNIIIASYEDYVNTFFNFIRNGGIGIPITMTRWNTSYNSSILDTGLAFKYSDIPYDKDSEKVNLIIDHPCYEYLKNLALNMGFSILKNNPNVLLFDIMSPATEPYRTHRGLNNLELFFENRFIKTYTIDMYYLLNNINIYYNKHVNKNPIIDMLDMKCGKPYTKTIELELVDVGYRVYPEEWELLTYVQVRNMEEGNPFTDNKLNHIYKKAKYFLKKLDKMSAMGYINDMFRDQVWNKDHGYHDSLQKLRGKTTDTSGRRLRGEGASSGGTSGGGGGSGY